MLWYTHGQKINFFPGVIISTTGTAVIVDVSCTHWFSPNTGGLNGSISKRRYMVDITPEKFRVNQRKTWSIIFQTWVFCFASKLDSFQWPQLVSEIDKGLRQEKIPPPCHRRHRRHHHHHHHWSNSWSMSRSNSPSYLPGWRFDDTFSCARPNFFWVKFLAFCRLLFFWN